MVKVICTTTINPPTEALKLFADMEGWQLVVAGDKKTPTNWHIPGSIYLSPELQEDYDKKLSDAIGWNCMQRRNFALLYAYDMHANICAVVDDDNLPLEHWGQNLMVGQEIRPRTFAVEDAAFDPVGVTNYPHLWHRGFPLQLLSTRKYDNFNHLLTVPDVQADFWQGDPDIDAVCRMAYAPECDFESKYFPMASNKISPFNSQNTFLLGGWLHNYFLFPGIGRMDDIWASYFLQHMGAKVVYGRPSVYHKRNPHDLVKDMKSEYLGYEYNLEIAGNPRAMFKYIPKESQRAFDLYQKHF